MRTYQTVFDNIAQYPEYRAGVEYWSPEVLNYHIDYDRTDDPNFIFNSVNTFARNVYINLGGRKGEFADNELILKYLTVEDERAYTADENPFFVNPTLGDYRIREGADFADIHFEEIGRY